MMSSSPLFLSPGSLRRPAALALLLGLGACSQAPVYQRPEVTTTAAFREAAWQDARAASPDVPDDWWLQFDDPVLTGLQARVLVNNQNLQTVLAQLRTAEASLASSRAARYPTVTGSLGETRSRSGTTSSTGTSTSASPVNIVSASANASWDADLWGRLAGAVDVSGAQLQASRDDLLATRLSVQISLAQSYFSLRSTEAQAESVARAVSAYVAQAQTQLKSAQAQLIELRLQRSQLEHAIAVLLGEVPANFSLPVTARLPRLPEAPQLLPATLLQRRPDIAAAERRVAAANAQVGVTKAAFFPSLTLSANAGYRSNQWSDL